MIDVYYLFKQIRLTLNNYNIIIIYNIMSLATFKKKSINKYSSATKRSGKPPGGYWLTQGPFGNDTFKNFMLEDSITNYGPVWIFS